MLSVTATFARRTTPCRIAFRCLATKTANDCFQRSSFLHGNFQISEEETVQKAVEKFTAFDVGCLVTIDSEGKISGVVSERDVIKKVGIKDNACTTEIKVKEILTSNPITVVPMTSVEECMEVMLDKNIRHLPLVKEKGGLDVVGLISIMDCVDMVLDHQEETIHVLSNFALGKSGHFIVD
mmetsp:Transcript_22463/g.24832  ORF Transcript_22463/g.24832 Transcript_22463/m.24832 type:complete len:181 (+) Transcript_22463:112-654(+)